MRVLQRDYDYFYEKILEVIEKGYFSTSNCACGTINSSIISKLKHKLNVADQEIKRRMEAYDNDISLVERKYGSYIDEHYKSLFIVDKHLHLDTDKLVFRAAEDIKKKYNTSGVDIDELLSRREKKKLSFVKKIKNLLTYKE